MERLNLKSYTPQSPVKCTKRTRDVRRERGFTDEIVFCFFNFSKKFHQKRCAKRFNPRGLGDVRVGGHGGFVA